MDRHSYMFKWRLASIIKKVHERFGGSSFSPTIMFDCIEEMN